MGISTSRFFGCLLRIHRIDRGLQVRMSAEVEGNEFACGAALFEDAFLGSVIDDLRGIDGLPLDADKRLPLDPDGGDRLGPRPRAGKRHLRPCAARVDRRRWPDALTRR